MRNIFQDCIARQAERLVRRGKYGKMELSTLEATDIPDKIGPDKIGPDNIGPEKIAQ